MQSIFQYRRYAANNSDLAERYGSDDEISLRDHFQRYGQHEIRGFNVKDYINIEGVVISDRGQLYLAGWADRRMLPNLSLSIEIGYLRYDLGEVKMCWFHRGDVEAVIGDHQMPSAFIFLIKLADFRPHPQIRIYINNMLMHEQTVARPVSPGVFLNQTLGACAVLSDQPIGMTLSQAQELYPAFSSLWSEVLNEMQFVRSFVHHSGTKIQQTVIIAIYGKADMLLVQLSSLAKSLQDTNTEVIVVGNELQAAEQLMAELTAFCQIHPIDLSVWLCSGNSGFSAANNFGSTKARGEVLIFMNPDIFPPEIDDGSTARDFFTRNPGQALHGALLYYGDGLLMHSGMYTTGDIVFDARSGSSHEILRVEHFGKGLSHHIEDPDLGNVTDAISGRDILVSAALWKIRRDVFNAVGKLSTDYIFAYYEDADFCLQLLKAGYKIKLDTNSRWVHMEGVGKPKPPSMRTFMWLNRAFYTKRFLGDPLIADSETDLAQL